MSMVQEFAANHQFLSSMIRLNRVLNFYRLRGVVSWNISAQYGANVRDLKGILSIVGKPLKLAQQKANYMVFSPLSNDRGDEQTSR